MTEQNQNPLAAEDPLLDKQLLALKRVTPRIGFENRVLSRVWRPAPLFWLVFMDRVREYTTPGRRWLAAGLASLGSAAMTLVLLNNFVVYENIDAVKAGIAQASDPVTWNRVGEAAMTGMTSAAGYVSAIPAASISQWSGIATGALLVPVISLVGLYVVLRRPARERVRSYASR